MSTIIGVETRGMPSADTGTQDYCAVLVQGDADDVACYLGIGTPQWVAAEGAKVTLDEARIYFPPIDSVLAARGLTYRR